MSPTVADEVLAAMGELERENRRVECVRMGTDTALELMDLFKPEPPNWGLLHRLGEGFATERAADYVTRLEAWIQRRESVLRADVGDELGQLGGAPLILRSLPYFTVHAKPLMVVEEVMSKQ